MADASKWTSTSEKGPDHEALDVLPRSRGKVAIVTGAGSGIGQATAKRIAAEAGSVVCVDLFAETAEKAAAEITEAGGTAIGVACDVSSAADCEATVATAFDTYGRVDALCNIAGIGTFANSHEMDTAQFDKIVAVNLNGSAYMIRFVLPHMLEQGGGVIVNTSSSAGLFGQPYSAAYCASKGGVIQLTKAIAEEYKDRNVRCNAICPGGVDTPIIHSFVELPEGGDYKKIRKMMTPMGASKPEEMAGLFAYMVSDEARYMTGSIVPLDGGITC